MKSQLVYVWG